MEVTYGLCCAGEFVYIEDTVSAALQGGLKMFRLLWVHNIGESWIVAHIWSQGGECLLFRWL